MADLQNNTPAEEAREVKKYKHWTIALGILSCALAIGCIVPYVQKGNADRSKTADSFVANDFEYWTEDSEPKEVLYEFVEDAVDPESDGYIPQENRVAVFDMDGTLLSETNPYYFEWMMFFHRVLDDDTYQAPEEIKKFVLEQAQPAVYAGKVSDEIDAQFSKYQAEVYKDMDLNEYEKYVQEFMDLPVNGQENMTYGQSFYMPMRNVVDFLQDNDFDVYVVSGADRFTTRAAVNKELNIPKDHVIGSDTEIVASSQGDENGEFYTFTSDQHVQRGDDLIKKNLKTNKVTAIAREIGKQPVLAFGNSSGDESMCVYTITNNEYPAEAFLLLCDDTERDHGNEEKAEKTEKMCEEDGFNSVSMKDDFVTIYPEGATITDIETK